MIYFLGCATLGLAIVLIQLVRWDLKSYRLPDAYTLPLILLGIGVNAVWEMALPWQALWGAIIGYGVFWGIGTVFYKTYHQEGLGLGDAKLFAAAGAWVGIFMLPMVLLIASSSALLFVLITRQNLQGKIAFGPWLALGFWAAWCLRLIETLDL